MKRLWVVMFAVALIGILTLAGCGGGGSATQAPAGTEASGGEALDRPEPPAEYASLTNPINCDDAANQAGQQVFSTNCASCHGETGAGDGPAAAALDPKPAPLAEEQGGLTDQYMFWRISEGGQMAPFNSAMPAWKSVLSEDQIWQTVCYIHTF